MWDNVDNTIQIIEPWIDLINRKTDLCNPNCFPQDNEGCSLKYSHTIGEFVPMKEPHDFMYEFKSQCKSINEWFSKLEGCLHSRQKNKSKTFTPLGNKFLPPSKKYHLDKLPYYISNETEGSLWLWS